MALNMSKKDNEMLLNLLKKQKEAKQEPEKPKAVPVLGNPKGSSPVAPYLCLQRCKVLHFPQ